MKKTLLACLIIACSSQVSAFDIVLNKKAVNPDTGAVVNMEIPPEAVAANLNAFTVNPVIVATAKIWPWDNQPTATNANTGGCNPSYSWSDGNLNQAEQWMVTNCTTALVKADNDLNNAHQRIKSHQIASKTTPNLFTNRWFRGWVVERDENILKAIASGMSVTDIQTALAAFYLERVNLIASEM